MNHMRDWKKINSIVICMTCILALSLIVLPLLMIAKYNYPSADDWSYSVYGYNALKRGEGFSSVIIGALVMAKDSYMNWEGRFSATFLAALQPGLWGEKYYGIVPWLMLGCIIFSEIYLCKNIIKIKSTEYNGWLSIPIMIPALILQILYTPFPTESFYWYTGSVNYTFIYGLSLVLLVLFINLGMTDYAKWKYVLLSFVAIFLAMLVGGDNFATSLSCFLTLFILSALFLVLNKKAFRRTWFITVVSGTSLLLCIFAPGNMNRIAENFNGETRSAISAIVMSLVRSCTNIYSWTNLKVILMLLFIMPFVWKAVRATDYLFRYPGLFTLITFGLYASQATATMYVDGTTGGGRMAAILFYSFYIWIVGNFYYWIGWISRRPNKFRDILDMAIIRLEKYILLHCALLGLILVGIIYFADLHNVSSYQAYRNWRQGWAQQYAVEWEARLEILHDGSRREVEFEPLSVPADLLLLYADLQDENGYIWVNSACATYYDKEYIHVCSQLR